MKDRAKKSRRFHPLSLRLICTEILAMLVLTVITAILSIVWYKVSLFAAISKNDRVLASNIVYHYDREKSTEETSANWIPDGYVQDLFDWTTDTSHTFYFLFDETGTCLICSGQVNCNRSEITLNLDILGYTCNVESKRIPSYDQQWFSGDVYRTERNRNDLLSVQ